AVTRSYSAWAAARTRSYSAWAGAVTRLYSAWAEAHTRSYSAHAGAVTRSYSAWAAGLRRWAEAQPQPNEAACSRHKASVISTRVPNVFSNSARWLAQAPAALSWAKVRVLMLQVRLGGWRSTCYLSLFCTGTRRNPRL